MAQPNKKLGLGKGIRALLDTIDLEMQTPAEGVVAHNDHNINSIARIAIDQIVENPKQPRRDFDERALKELSESIQLHDIIQPITVMEVFLSTASVQLIAGKEN